MGVPYFWYRTRRLVELRGARLERCVGVGPGGERITSAVDHRHCLHSLGDGARAPWAVACLERVVIDCHF